MKLVKRRKKAIRGKVQVEPAQKSIVDYLKNAKDLRDYIVAGAGVLYILGYLVWSLNAFEDHLGLLPAAEAQYFAAGFPMAIIIIIAVLVWRFTTIIGILITKLIKNRLLTFLAVLVVIFLTEFLQSKYDETYHSASTTHLLSLALGCVILQLCLVVMRERIGEIFSERNGKILQRTSTIFEAPLKALTQLLLFSAAAMFLLDGYRSIPREFGGIKTRYAVVMVKRSELPTIEREILLMPGDRNLPKNITKPIEDPIPVVPTKTLDVLYEGSDSLIVRPHAAKGKGPTIEIKRANIQGIIWYGYTAPPDPQPTTPATPGKAIASPKPSAPATPPVTPAAGKPVGHP